MILFLLFVQILYASACILNDGGYRRQGGHPGQPPMPPRTPRITQPRTLPTMGYTGLMTTTIHWKDQFQTTKPTTEAYKRTIPDRVSLKEHCDYLAYYCLKAYQTGRLCARTVYYTYQNFDNYCLMDYVNCVERYEVWQIVHMGECFEVLFYKRPEYTHYEYTDDSFLDQTYVIDD